MYIERDVKERFDKVAKVYNLVAVVGARQAGKTTFLREHIKNRHASYVLFDDPDARALFEEDIKKFEKQYINGYELAVLDEVQYCKDAGRKLKYLAEKNKKIWLTSSSEAILAKEILSYLVGRVSIIKLYPFSISEFLAAKGQKEVTSNILQRNVWEHITYGGYPKVVITDDNEIKKVILRDLYDTMLLKDIARTFSIEDIKALESFTKYLSVNIGSLLSYENISRDIKMSFHTMRKYLDAMEKSYLIVRIQPFYRNKSKEITKQPKIYFVDIGLRNAIANEFNQDPNGLQFENYVLSELLKFGMQPKHWRSKAKAEVDFVIEKDNCIIPIETKLNAEPGRVERSLHSFINTYKPKSALVVTYKGKNGKTNINGCSVHFTDILGMRKILIE